MKRLAIIIGLVVLSISIFAQEKGELYMFVSASASFGKVTNDTYTYYSNGFFECDTEEKPLDTYLGLDLGIGYFLLNNLRLELGLGVSSEKDPTIQMNSDWLYSIHRGFNVCPNLSYYFRLAEGFYYTPEIGANFNIGTYYYQESHNKTWDFPYRGYSLYANLLALEYRVGPHFALTTQVGDLAYTHRDYYEDDNLLFSGKSVLFQLNSASVCAHIYF
jgi:hypothetical protein